MLGFLKNILDDNQRALNKLQPLVEQINALEPKIKKLSDAKLAAQTKKFKDSIAKRIKDIPDSELAQTEAAILDELLPEAFATVRETSRRLLGMRHYDVQLLAGIALHRGMVTEQRTGEGKTLTVTAPLYLNALLGKGAHLVTVNDYLAEIGTGWMGPIYHFLGMSTAVIVHDKATLYNPSIDSEDRGDERLEHFENISRQAAYAADITYGTNNEFGFDYLRDNMVQHLRQMVQRTQNAHHFAIIDEADSILIDEARTPLIISAPDTEPTDKYYRYTKLVQALTKDQDYSVDEKARSVTLTDLGVKRIEQKLGVKNLYEEDFDTIHHVEAALKARTLFSRDKEYIVRDNQVIIVDEHTGRLMYGRRYSDGLHQAIEAKENVPIQQESRTLATISIQNYFRQYHKLAGMTGTAATEAEEFDKIYGMRVLVVPTNKPVVRQDKTDAVYKTQAAKFTAIAKQVAQIHQSGQPILIGTRSIEHNEIVSSYLKRKKITHQVLNAKNHEREAFIIADAGKPGAITVATNIAGRGVDIVLGGAKPELKDYRKKTKSSTTKLSDKTAQLAKELSLPPSINPNNYSLTKYQKALQDWQSQHDQVISQGGLYIIGTERHESRRIDNQLRGRAGRQGDPGVSQFYLALEDDIMRIFGGEAISRLMTVLKVDESQPIEAGLVAGAIEAAQKKVEGFFFDQRKRLVDFDDVMNRQRDIIYKRRRRLLQESSDALTKHDNQENQDPTGPLTEQIQSYIADEITTMVALRAPENFTTEEIDAITKEFAKIIPFDDASQRQLRDQLLQTDNVEDITTKLISIADKTYQARQKSVGATTMRQLEQFVTLSTIDEKWMDHLDEMDRLRQGIWLRGNKETVLAEYQKEAFSLFEQLIGSIESTIASRIFRIQPEGVTEPTVVLSQAQAIKEDINEPLAKEVADAQVPLHDEVQSNKEGNLDELAAALGSTKTTTTASQPGKTTEKVGRNDPCPCGSGKKYKKCGLLNTAEHKRLSQT